MATIAKLEDADITLTLDEQEGAFRVLATRYDSTSVPVDALDATCGSLSEAIKAIMVFYVQEWESVFVKNRLSEKLAQAIQAG
jgi:hypothetical protein